MTVELLYSFSMTYGDYFELPVTLLLIGIGFFLCTLRETWLKNGIIKRIMRGVSVLSMVFSLVCLVSSMVSYAQIKNRMENHDYEVCSGPVEQFVPAPSDGHGSETFVVNDVRFEYSDYSATYGYHTTYHHGGVIRENGQEVLIHYLWDEESGSVYILQIYELSD